MERVTYSASGDAIEHTFTDYRSDRYTYRVHLKR
jgi:DNA-binding GntR family transcriptional regulator